MVVAKLPHPTRVVPGRPMVPNSTTISALSHCRVAECKTLSARESLGSAHLQYATSATACAVGGNSRRPLLYNST